MALVPNTKILSFISLWVHEENYGIIAGLNFFGTSHSISPCGGIGGRAKRLAAYSSLQRPIDHQKLTQGYV